jgi:hypothetical protein
MTEERYSRKNTAKELALIGPFIVLAVFIIYYFNYQGYPTESILFMAIYAAIFMIVFYDYRSNLEVIRHLFSELSRGLEIKQ